VRRTRSAERSNHAASQSKTIPESCGLMPQIFWSIAMTRIGRPAVAVALALMLSPVLRDIGTASAGVELARGGRPAYAPCAWAKPGRTCYAGHGLASGGHRRR
jgi:hypothetical protein